MLKDRVAYYHDHCNLNCAEIMLHCANDEWNLDLDEKTYKAIACFGGGAASGKFCGAIAGSLAAIGEKYINVKFRNTEGLKDKVQAFVAACEEKLGSLDCAVLKEKYNVNNSCQPTIELVAEILQSEIDKIENAKAE
ncbi:MAG: C-GCAxxG-C-C family protein [Oscillospiraceae bacterium]|nr:C-GCAxxG-C-C family protein [Oscillospiraceae bacterium]